MPIRQVIEGRVPIKIWALNVEPAAEQQLKNIAALPFVYKQVCAMPDVHLGVGATVGSVVATRGAVCPAAVGVDIGCGMMAIKLNGVKAEHLGNLAELRHSIERSVPVGFEANRKMDDDVESWGGWGKFELLHQGVQGLKRKAMLQMGSLGGGNHFIEVCLDTNNEVWIMLHSGSRNIGKSIAEKYIDDAKSLMGRMYISLPDPDLAYYATGTPEFKAYISDLSWAQDYAFKNRQVMMDRVYKDFCYWLKRTPGIEKSVNCHHNFAAMENHFGQNVLVTRKGAVRARADDMGIIPGSMGTRSYIVRGLGNPESFHSCSHGAGRRMSRNKAREAFTLEDVAQQLEGVECRRDAGIIDELPGAYKPIEQVMEDQSDLVVIEHELKQVLCVKG